jgi:hypothetical protein
MIVVASTVLMFVIAVMVMVAVMIVILMVPMAFMESPALLIVVIVRMNPISTGIRWTFPMSCGPAVVVVADWNPISLDPVVLRLGWRRRLFVTDWGRTHLYINRDLRGRRNSESHCEQCSAHPLQPHLHLLSKT